MTAYEKGYADGFNWAKSEKRTLLSWTDDAIARHATVEAQENYLYAPTRRRYHLGFLSGVRHYKSTERIYYS